MNIVSILMIAHPINLEGLYFLKMQMDCALKCSTITKYPCMQKAIAIVFHLVSFSQD